MLTPEAQVKSAAFAVTSFSRICRFASTNARIVSLCLTATKTPPGTFWPEQLAPVGGKVKRLERLWSLLERRSPDTQYWDTTLARKQTIGRCQCSVSRRGFHGLTATTWRQILWRWAMNDLTNFCWLWSSRRQSNGSDTPLGLKTGGFSRLPASDMHGVRVDYPVGTGILVWINPMSSVMAKDQ